MKNKKIKKRNTFSINRKKTIKYNTWLDANTRQTISMNQKGVSGIITTCANKSALKNQV